MFTVIAPFLQKQKSLNPWTRTKLEGRKTCFLLSRKNASEKQSSLKKKKRGTEEIKFQLSFVFSKVYISFTTRSINFLCCIPQCGLWWFWWIWVIVSMVLSDMSAASLFPYITPLGYHYPVPPQTDSKSELLGINPLRSREPCIQMKESRLSL